MSPSGRRDRRAGATPTDRGDRTPRARTRAPTGACTATWAARPTRPGLRPRPRVRPQRRARADGKLACVAYWDSGFIALDLTESDQPDLQGPHGRTPSNADGDAHSSNCDEERKLLFAADEDFCKTSGSGTERGSGYLRVYNSRTLSAPKQIGTFKTPTPPEQGRKAGNYTIHNPLVVGTDVYISWYSDGIRVVDGSNPGRVERGCVLRATGRQQPGRARPSAVCSRTRPRHGAWPTRRIATSCTRAT